MKKEIINILNKLNADDRADIVKDLTERENSLQENLKLLKNTNELIQAVNSTNNIREMFEITQKKLSLFIDTANFIIALLDVESNLITFPYFVDEKDDLGEIVGKTNSIPADQEGSLTVMVLKSGKPTIFTKEHIEKIYSKIDNKAYLGSIPNIWYGFPLKIKDETIGVIIIQSYSKTFKINETNFKLLEYISAHLAPSIERRIVEDRLKRVEEKFSSLIENSQDLIYQTDLKGNITFISKSVENLSGYTLEESIGINMAEQVYVHPAERELFLSLIKQNGSVLNFEAELKRKDGSTWWASTNAHFLKDHIGNIIGVEGITRDISEKKETEKSLLASEEKYRTLFEKSQDAALIIENGKFVDCNQATVSMLKYKDKNELLQTHPSQLSPEKQTDGRSSGEKADEMMSIALSKGSNRFEWDHMKADGEVFPVEVLLTSISRESEVKAIHTVWRDISERKKAELAVIENQRLGAIGEMASAVAHDFNNALQSILGYIELSLHFPALPEKLHKYIMVMKRAAIDATTRVQLLQRFGGKKKSRSNYVPVSMNSVVRDVIEQSRPVWKDRAERDGVDIAVDVKYKDIPDIMGNEGELRSVLYNIIKNGVESIRDNGKIFIETNFNQDDIIITVTDSGIGMDSDTIARVFQPLFSSKGFELGRGYGMSGSYSIIQEHKGKLYIKESKPGIGTTVEIKIPHILLNSKIKSEPEVFSKSLKGLRILWVDDDPVIRDIAMQYMDLLELNGDVVSSGSEALSNLKNIKYNIVITDIGMPKMNGWQLAKEIKKKHKNEVKVAVVTGWGEQVDSDIKEENGVEFVLGKPITLNQVKKLINKIVF